MARKVDFPWDVVMIDFRRESVRERKSYQWSKWKLKWRRRMLGEAKDEEEEQHELEQSNMQRSP